MAKEINFDIKGITEAEATLRLRQERDKILSEFTKAYLAETGLKPSEIELVSQRNVLGSLIEETYFFRKK
jgi:predicted metal-dependent hydrolase